MVGESARWRPRSIRLRGYDYRSAGAYFVTVCADHKQVLFVDDRVAAAVAGVWLALPEHFGHLRLDEFVVMPNHVHGILWITHQPTVVARHASLLRPGVARPRGAARGSLGAIVGSFKSAATKRINDLHGTPGKPVWQRNYYERVIRNEDELTRIREYVQLNPLKWELDRENPGRRADRAYDTQWAWLEGDMPERVPVAARR